MAASSVTTRIPAPLLLLAIVESLVLCLSVYVAALAVFVGNLEQGEQTLGPLIPRAICMSAIMLLSFVSVGLYQFHQRIDYSEVSTKVLVGFALGSLALIAIFGLPDSKLAAGFWGSAIAIAGASVLLIRLYFVNHVDENIFRRRTLIYGTGSRAEAIATLRRRADRRGFQIVGYVPAIESDDPDGCDSANSAGRSSLSTLALESGAEEIVIAVDDRRGKLPIRALLDRRLRGVEVIDLVEFLERETGKIPVELVTPGWLIFSKGFRQSRARLFAKRVRDVAIAGVALLVAWPLLIAIAAAIKIEDGWRSPVFYRQKRVGYLGSQFELLKFRSMIVNAEADGQAVWAAENDDRITRVGRLIRRFRFDELPQVFNVLRGHMSIVGPRPERPEFVEELSESIPFYVERHTVKPGITGWAQLRYVYGASEEAALEKLRYDLYYVKNHSLFLDLVIILQTAEIILWSKGAR